MEKINLESQPEDEKLKQYIYRDNSAGGKIIFQCSAEDILAADKLYEEKTGEDPRKQGHVGCSIKQNYSETEKKRG